MRTVLALLLTLTACAADPVLLPEAGAPVDTGQTVSDVGWDIGADAGQPAVDLGASTVDAPAARVCVPGAQVGCVCIGGATGAQICNAEGSALGGCMCPDAGTTVDIQPAIDRPAVPDAGLNRGVRFQACRTIGAPCSDGSTCLQTISYGTAASPRGLCSIPCDMNGQCADYTPDGGDPATVRCIFSRTTLGHCAIRCAAGNCPRSTQCYGVGVLNKPGLPPYCQPQTDP